MLESETSDEAEAARWALSQSPASESDDEEGSKVVGGGKAGGEGECAVM